MLTAKHRPPSTGWYTRPPPPMQRRGRSRQVSSAALARHASEERRYTALQEIQQKQAKLLASTCVPEQPPQPSQLLDSEKSNSPIWMPAETQSCIPHSAMTIPSEPNQPPVVSSRSPSPTPSQSPTPPSSEDSDSSNSVSLSPDYYDSPPSPPRSLQDQVQVAYALDDIKLAKILLLKLKGIEITSDDDPRIDEVKDEDFDICFVPAGPLVLEEKDRLVAEEGQRRERERWEQSQRMERLKACEKIWEEEKRKLRNERLHAQKKREEELAREQEQRRMADAKEREELERFAYHRSPRIGITAPAREVLSYNSLSHSRLEPRSPTRDEEPFQYSFMPVSVSPVHRSVGSTSPRYKKGTKMYSPCGMQQTVPFKDVVASMHGQLFPLDPAEQALESKRSSANSLISPALHGRKTRIRDELLDSLLKVVEWEEGEKRTAKGKTAQKPVRYGEKSSSSCRAPLCAACSAVSTSTSSTGTTASRTSSWLSFGSRASTLSISTAMTSPATSPISPPVKSPIAYMSLHARSETREVATTHCCYPQRALVPVALAHCPLSIAEPRSASQKANGFDRAALPKSDSQPELSASGSIGRTFVQRVSLSVTGFVGIAKGLQSAYIAAAMFSVGSPYNLHPDSPSSLHKQCSSNFQVSRPAGYRACHADVSIFIASVDEDSVGAVEPVHFIPLISPFPPPLPSTSCGADSPARMRSCSPHPSVATSPLRPRTPPSALAYRMRPIANPALLRLRALQNLMYARGKEWEGHAREGGLGCGKERMLGIAFEGRGRSGLGCEVRFVAVV